MRRHRRQRLIVTRKGKEKIVGLPLDEYPVLLHFPILSTPGYFFPKDYEKGVRLTGIATILFGPNPREVAKRLGADAISIPG